MAPATSTAAAGRRRELRCPTSCPRARADPCTDPNLNSVNPTRLVAPVPGDRPLPGPQGPRPVLRLRAGQHGARRRRRSRRRARSRPRPRSPRRTGTRWSTRRASRSTCAARSRRAAAATAACSRWRRARCPTTQRGLRARAPAGTATAASAAAASTGVLGSVDVAELRRASRRARATSPAASPAPAGQSSNGRPELRAVRLHACGCAVESGELRGEDRRNLFLHRDSDLLPGFPRALASDGAASPTLRRPRRRQPQRADRGRPPTAPCTPTDPTAARRRAGRSAATAAAAHAAARAFASGAVSPRRPRRVPRLARRRRPRPRRRARGGGRRLRGPVYAWDADGTRRWTRGTNPDWSGRPLQPFDEARKGERNRTQRGFLGSPVLADLDGDARLEVVAAAMDRHVYAWRADGDAPCRASRRSSSTARRWRRSTRPPTR